MPQRTDLFELAGSGCAPARGGGSSCTSASTRFAFGGQRYDVEPELVPVRLDVSRTTGSGYALRLRFEATLRGPCMRCLEPATPDLRRRRARGHAARRRRGAAVALRRRRRRPRPRGVGPRRARARPARRRSPAGPDCAGLCPQCGANLNEDPDHAHEAEPDPRWAKLCEIEASTRSAAPLPFLAAHGRPQAEAVALAHTKRRSKHKIARAGAQRVPAVPPAAPPAPGVPALRLLRRARGRRPPRSRPRSRSRPLARSRMTEPVTVAVDANGADLGPGEVARGAAIAAAARPRA